MIKASLDYELKKIIDISKSYGARKIILFGSCLENTLAVNDIDIAVSGVLDRDFFKLYGKISMELDDEIDLIDLDDIPKHFRNRILSKGKVLYERLDN